MRVGAFVLVVCVACADLRPADAQDNESGALSALGGRWIADCDGFQEGAACELEWAPGLGGDLMRVRYEVRGDGGARLFAGDGVYKPSYEGFEGYWSDSNGSLHPLQATYADGVLTTLWGRPETEEGRTVYAATGDGGLSVTDWVKVDGDWRQFMHADYVRADDRAQ